MPIGLLKFDTVDPYATSLTLLVLASTPSTHQAPADSISLAIVLPSSFRLSWCYVTSGIFWLYFLNRYTTTKRWQACGAVCGQVFRIESFMVKLHRQFFSIRGGHRIRFCCLQVAKAFSALHELSRWMRRLLDPRGSSTL